MNTAIVVQKSLTFCYSPQSSFSTEPISVTIARHLFSSFAHRWCTVFLQSWAWASNHDIANGWNDTTPPPPIRTCANRRQLAWLIEVGPVHDKSQYRYCQRWRWLMSSVAGISHETCSGAVLNVLRSMRWHKPSAVNAKNWPSIYV